MVRLSQCDLPILSKVDSSSAMSSKLYLGHRLRRLRRERQLSQTEMATTLGISPSYLNHLERNQRPVTAALLLKLAELYDVDVRSFAAGGGTHTGPEALAEIFSDALLADIGVPRYELAEGERIGPWTAHRELLRRPAVSLYFLAIFCYVGSEQGIANWISKFLATYHGFNPQVEGARAVAMFWGLMTVGCVLGLVLLKLFDSRKVLIGFAAAAILTLTAALGGGAALSYYSFMALGFVLSVMWSVIFSLALNSVERHHGSFSGILCTAIVGGAFVSLAVGWLGERVGLRAGMLLLYVPLGYILSIGFWARPLVHNATVSVRELLAWRRRPPSSTVLEVRE